MADRTTWGCVNADGTLHSGTAGTVVTREDTGLYTIRFAAEYECAPAVVVTQNYPGWDDFSSAGGNTRDNAVLVALDADRCKVATGDRNGARVDRNFTFVAAGSVGIGKRAAAAQKSEDAAKAGKPAASESRPATRRKKRP